eukprot:3105062-Amphidinium_carterae.1
MNASNLVKCLWVLGENFVLFTLPLSPHVVTSIQSLFVVIRQVGACPLGPAPCCRCCRCRMEGIKPCGLSLGCLAPMTGVVPLLSWKRCDQHKSLGAGVDHDLSN